MDEILHLPLGNLFIYEPEKPLVKEQLFSYDEFTIGRSHTQRYQVSKATTQVSGHHAVVEINQGKVVLYDAQSLNGTYVNGQQVDRDTGVELSPGIRVYLGGKGKNACQVWFEPLATDTTLVTQTRLTKNG